MSASSNRDPPPLVTRFYNLQRAQSSPRMLSTSARTLRTLKGFHGLNDAPRTLTRVTRAPVAAVATPTMAKSPAKDVHLLEHPPSIDNAVAPGVPGFEAWEYLFRQPLSNASADTADLQKVAKDWASLNAEIAKRMSDATKKVDEADRSALDWENAYLDKQKEVEQTKLKMKEAKAELNTEIETLRKLLAFKLENCRCHETDVRPSAFIRAKRCFSRTSSCCE
eukprot:GEMP01026195.1.p1 GENE.GEMP01026195.1~~GEMP01026195.1.p1  ORF type:complete len:223 (+),score=45.26 GEMP01026195.1:708-1376(+)